MHLDDGSEDISTTESTLRRKHWGRGTTLSSKREESSSTWKRMLQGIYHSTDAINLFPATKNNNYIEQV